MDAQAESLAQKLSYYIELQTTYCDVLRTDPTKMEQMRKAQTQDPNVLQVIDPYYFKDVDGLLANYDEALMHVPKTYEECAISVTYIPDQLQILYSPPLFFSINTRLPLSFFVRRVSSRSLTDALLSCA